MARQPKEYPTITATSADYRVCMAQKKPFLYFRQILESRGLIHSRSLDIESWDDPEGTGNRFFRNKKPQTAAEIASQEAGAGRVR
jgi:hypothetical protein